MAGPGWLTGSLAAAMLVTAAYCATRLVVARLWQRSTERAADVIHLVMGVAMAGMLVPRLNPLWFPAWEVIFGAAIAWFAWQAGLTRRAPGTTASTGPTGAGHHLAHVLACGTMLYMLFAAASIRASDTAPGASALGSAMPHPPTVALILAVVMAGYVVWTTDRLTSLTPVRAAARMTSLSPTADHPGPGPASSVPADSLPGTTPSPLVRPPLSPRLAASCQIAMGITMGYMLIQML